MYCMLSTQDFGQGTIIRAFKPALRARNYERERVHILDTGSLALCGGVDLKLQCIEARADALFEYDSVECVLLVLFKFEFHLCSTQD